MEHLSSTHTPSRSQRLRDEIEARFGHDAMIRADLNAGRYQNCTGGRVVDGLASELRELERLGVAEHERRFREVRRMSNIDEGDRERWV